MCTLALPVLGVWERQFSQFSHEQRALNPPLGHATGDAVYGYDLQVGSSATFDSSRMPSQPLRLLGKALTHQVWTQQSKSEQGQLGCVCQVGGSRLLSDPLAVRSKHFGGGEVLSVWVTDSLPHTQLHTIARQHGLCLQQMRQDLRPQQSDSQQGLEVWHHGASSAGVFHDGFQSRF